MLQGSSWKTLQLLSPLLEVSALICSSLLRERMQTFPLQSHTKLATVPGGQHFQSQLFSVEDISCFRSHSYCGARSGLTASPLHRPVL